MFRNLYLLSELSKPLPKQFWPGNDDNKNCMTLNLLILLKTWNLQSNEGAAITLTFASWYWGSLWMWLWLYRGQWRLHHPALLRHLHPRPLHQLRHQHHSQVQLWYQCGWAWVSGSSLLLSKYIYRSDWWVDVIISWERERERQNRTVTVGKRKLQLNFSIFNFQHLPPLWSLKPQVHPQQPASSSALILQVTHVAVDKSTEGPGL